MSKKPPSSTDNATLHPSSILRKKNNNNNKKRPHSHASVSFQNTTDAASSSRSSTLHPVNSNKSAKTPPSQDDDVSYDSDDLYDSVAYSGSGAMGVTSSTAKRGNNDDSDDNDDGISLKMKALKKKRQQKLDVDSDDDDDNNNNNTDPDSFRGEETTSDRELSLKSLYNQDDLEYPVEAFNMNEERESGEGYFDGDTYIFRKERVEDDAWVKSLNEDDDDATRLSSGAKSYPSLVAQGAKEPVRNVEEERSSEEIYGELAGLMAEGESVVMTLRRYGNVMKRKKITTKKDSLQAASSSSDDNAISMAKASLAKVTDLVDALFNKGDLTIYDRKRSELMERASSIFADADEENTTASSSMPQKRNYFEATTTPTHDDENKRQRISNNNNDSLSNDKQQQQQKEQRDQYEWEYRGNEDHQIHGPFTTQQMVDWTKAGYFVNDQAVDIRRRRINKNRHSDTDVAADGNADERKLDADDLMKDLLDDDNDDDEDQNGDGDKGDSKTEGGEWLRSDTVDFASFL